MPNQLRILVIGLATLDLHVQNLCMPPLDDHTYLDNYRFTPGGSAVNMAFSLAHLGARVTMCTRIGNDFAGLFVREFIERLGIKLIIHDSLTATGFSVINSGEDGRIALAHFEGANDEIALNDVPSSELAQNDVLHIAGAMSMKALDGEPMTVLLKQARALGKTTSLHTSRNTEKKHLLLPSLPYLDHLILNQKESRDITGCRNISDAARWLRDRGVQTVAITLGPDGAYVSDVDFSGRIAAPNVAAVDTTGCGDAFTAGFLVARARALDVSECAIWGNIVAGLCAQSRGPLPEPFTLDTVQMAVNWTKEQSVS